MPLEDAEPMTFEEAAAAARAKCRGPMGDAPPDQAALEVAEKGIERALLLIATPPLIVELLLNRTKLAMEGRA